MNDNSSAGGRCPLIIGYHSISERRTDALAVSVEEFEYQLKWLSAAGYRSVTLADFLAGRATHLKRIVILTFDDGYADNYTQAFPLLKRYGVVGTVFLVSYYVNQDRLFPWDAPKIKSTEERSLYQVLSWNQIWEMADYGIEFGSHTCSHRELPWLSAEERWEEISRSRQDLTARLGQQIVSFSYPRGKLDRETIEQVERAGYNGAVVTCPRAGIPHGRFTLRRIGVYHPNRHLTFRLKMVPLVRSAYERLLWLR